MGLRVNPTGLQINSTLGKKMFAKTQKGLPNSSGDPDRLMFFTPRNRFASAFLMPASAGLNYFAAKFVFDGPGYETSAFRFRLPGYAKTEGGLSPQETVLAGNDINVDGISIKIGAMTYAGDISGSTTAVVTSGSKGPWVTFPAGAKLPALGKMTVVVKWHVNAGQNFIGGYRIQKHRGEKFWAAADATALQALIDADSPVTTSLDVFYDTPPGNQTNSQQIAYGPDFMLAKGWQGEPVVLALVDSIGHSRQGCSSDATDRGAFGWVSQWLDDPSGGRIPHMIFGVPGSKASQECNTNALLSWDTLDDIKAFNNNKYPFTCVVNQLGTNDNNATFATWKSALTGSPGLMQRVKTRLGSSMPFLQCTIAPRNTTTNNYLNQGVIGISSAGTWQTNRNQLNSDIRTKNAFAHDGLIELDQCWTDYPTNPDKPKAASDMLLGQMVSMTPGDGASVYATAVVNFQPVIGDRYLIEYQSATYTTRVVWSVVNNGNGTWTIGLNSTSTTAFQANAPCMIAVSGDGIHMYPGYTRFKTVPALLALGHKSRLS